MTEATQERLTNALKKDEETSKLLTQLAKKLNIPEREVVRRICA